MCNLRYETSVDLVHLSMCQGNGWLWYDTRRPSVNVCRDILKQCMLNQCSDNSCHSLITWLLIFLRDALYYFFKIIIVLTKFVDRKYLPVSSFTNMIRFQSIVLLILFITSKNKNKREISDVHGDGGHVPTSFVQKRRDR